MKISKAQLENILASLHKSGKSFHVQFVKADGSIRDMDCRMNVTKHSKGNVPTYNGKNFDKGNIGVYEFGRDEKGHFTSNGYRSFNIDRVKSLKVGGNLYSVD
jgi:hypothetical protein